MKMRPPMQRFACVAVAVSLLAIGLLVWANQVNKADSISAFSAVMIVPDTPELTAEQQAAMAEDEQLRARGEFHKSLSMVLDYPGVEASQLVEVDAAHLPASTEIVGVEVDGESCAFVLNSMLHPSQHIFNTILNEKPLSVTYCNRVDCVRVLASDDDQPIPLHVGGLDVDNQMVLLLDGQRYGQSSTGLPLRDHPFNRMTLGEWTELHPSTKVYVGPSA